MRTDGHKEYVIYVLIHTTKKDKRVGTGKGMDLIISVLNLFRCNNLSELKGKTLFCIA